MTKELNWILPAVVLLSVEYAFAVVLGLRFGFSYDMAFGSHLITAAVLCAGLFVVALLLSVISGIRSGEAAPLAKLRADLSKPWLLCGMIGITLVTLQMAALNWTKSMIPFVVTFWADEPLAALDHALFSVDAWRVFHAVDLPFVDAAYQLWAPIKFAALLFLILMPASEAKSRALCAYFVLLFFGLVAQYALPSAGPIFYERLGLGDRYADLPFQHWTQMASDYLWQNYQTGHGDLGTGISAFPSMHVAVAAWIALSLGQYAPKWIGWVYFVVIAYGSVYLGWHYFMDAVGGFGLALLAWRVPVQRPVRSNVTMAAER